MATATVTASLADRLSSTLFVAALAHGVVILGVTFANEPRIETNGLPALNVTILVETESTEAPDTRTELLASRNALGGGRPDDADRPTTTLAADHPLSQLGDPLGADLTDGTPSEAAPEFDQLATRNPAERQIQAVLDATDTPSAEPMKAAALIQQTVPDTLAAEIDDQVQSQRSDDENAFTSPSAAESALAEYLVGWRQRVERVGTANFPQQYLSSASQLGRPIVEVAISPDGTLAEIVVQRSSGDEYLDQAALKILRMAGPFEPLPQHIVAEHDLLRFAYEWDFAAGAADPPGPLAAIN